MVILRRLKGISVRVTGKAFLSSAVLLVLMGVWPLSAVNSSDSLDAIFEQGRRVFFKTISTEVAIHPDSGFLSAAEFQKVMNLEQIYPRLYGLLINFYYAKEEPALHALLDEGGDRSLSEFRKSYCALAEFAAHEFVKTLFLQSAGGSYWRKILPMFAGKDAVEIVVMSTGYFAKLDLPGEKRKPPFLSPEFERQWGLDAGNFRTAHALTKGRGARIAVIDSGIDPSHPVFKNTSWGDHFAFVGRDGPPWACEAPMVDWGWHGTVVTSIVAVYAPEARITVYKDIDADTMNNSPFPWLVSSWMGAAIYKAVHDGNDIINISAGTNIDCDYLREACRYAYENNVIIVTANPYATGRYLGENLNFPGQYETTLSVTGIDRESDGRYRYWDVASPDAMTTVGAPDAPFVAYPTYVEEKDEYAPGISCATPIAAALAGLIVSVLPRTGTEAPGEYFELVKKLITDNADSRAVGFDGYSPECGYGLIDAEKSVRAALKLAEERSRMASMKGNGGGR
jgi:subtilisin family serine protease